MRVPTDVFLRIDREIRQLVEFYGADALRKTFSGKPKQLRWQLFYRVMDDLRYGNHHPRYSIGGVKRIVPQDSDFIGAFDSCNLKDAHIETMLKKIMRKLQFPID